MTSIPANKNLLFINKQFLNYCNNRESIEYSILDTSAIRSVTTISNDKILKCCNGLILNVMNKNFKIVLKKIIDNTPTLYTYDNTKYEISDVLHNSPLIKLKELFDIKNFIKLLDINYNYNVSNNEWCMYLKILKLKEI